MGERPQRKNGEISKNPESTLWVSWRCHLDALIRAQAWVSDAETVLRCAHLRERIAKSRARI